MKIQLFQLRLLLVLCLFCGTTRVHADLSVRVHPLHLDQAYRQDYDISVLRDADGYLWIASDNGLKRYDGYSLRTFSHDPKDPSTIGSSNIFRVFQDAKGTLWSLGGMLNRYHPETESFTRYPITDYKMMYVAADAADGGLWIGGDRIGLLLFDPESGKVRNQFLQQGDTPASVYRIIPKLNSKRLWLSTNQGVVLFDPDSGQSTTEFLLPDIHGFRTMMGLTQDAEGDLWIASRDGLYRFNPTTRITRHYTAKPGNPYTLPTSDLTSVSIDSRNNLWVGTEKQGVFRRDPATEKFVHYPASAYDAYRFPPAGISNIHEDSEGNMWFACGNHGVFRISEHLQKFKSFQHSFDSDNSLGLNHVSGLFEDSKGYIWIGTDGNGVDRFDPRDYSFQHFRHHPADTETLGSNAVMAIAEDSKGYLWLGTWAGGLNRLDPNTGKVQRFMRDPKAPEGRSLAGNHIFRIHIDAQDRLVMGVGRSGLQIFDPVRNHFQTFTPDLKRNPRGIVSEQINDILATENGNYWLGGYQPLELFSPQTGLSYIPDTGIIQSILDLHMDASGLLWIATDGGLFRFNSASGEVVHFSRKDGLSDDFIVGLEQDLSGKLWLATRNGLTRFDPLSRVMETYDQQDGLAGSQFNRFSHLRTRKGVLYFGTNQGFSFFDPQQIPRNEYAPKLHLTGLEINHQLQRPGESPWLKQALNVTDKLVLPSTADDLRITFVATNLVAPEKNRYRHRLMGQSDAWIDSRRQRSAQYSNLPPGTYTLQVMASNNDGVWTGSTRNLTLTILPAWWQTWWAYCLYLAAFIGSLYGFSLWRLQLTVRRRKELERQVHEQTAKLKDANRAVSQLNSELEQRVAQRTQDLSAEIEERKQSEAKATYIAYHDALTGLYNRAWVSQHIERLVGNHGQIYPAEIFAVLIVGGDRFRTVNETHGHQTGDRLLVKVAAMLRQLCPESAQLARLGSDEFVIVLDRVENREQVVRLADALIDVFKEPVAVDPLRLSFSISLGYVIADRHSADPAQVLRDANIAMQKAKDRGRGLSQEFDAEMLQQKLDNAALEADLKLALQREQFSVVYQPIILLNSLAIVGFEVLIRWRHPERGMVPPDRFIAMAETSGLICDIGLWVLEQACRQLQSWREVLGSAELPVIAVNLSPVQLEREDFLESMDRIFQRTRVDPAHIEFEITETALLRHTDTVDGTLEALRRRGIKLAIDDFGTGYSSLSYLDKLPVQVLKIDRSFVNALTDNNKTNNNANEIVRATITLAHNLSMSVVAEGIESQHQLSLLQSYGCDYGQGYFFARPMPPADATALLLQRHG